jgi:hypothetical protein
MAWWVSQSGILQGPASWATGNPDVAGPYLTAAAARAAFSSGVRPGGQSSPSAGTWWVVNSPASHVTPFITQQSKTKPPLEVAGPFTTEAEAESWIASQESKLPALPTFGLADIGKFFARLGQRATWVRIVKVIAGGILIIAGLARLAQPGAEKLASNLPKVIPV